MTPKGFIRVENNGIEMYLKADQIVLYYPESKGTSIVLKDKATYSTTTCEEIGKLIDEANGVAK
jgi:hypothetical protein